MRLIVARCEVRYSGRLEALLPEALRLVMVKSDGSVMVHADTGGFKPQNWMTPPTVFELERGGEPVPDEDVVPRTLLGPSLASRNDADGGPTTGVTTTDGGLGMESVAGGTTATLDAQRPDGIDGPGISRDGQDVPDPALAPITRIVVRKRAGSTEDRLDIRVVEVLSDVVHDMGEAAALEKSGVERELQELLADAPEWCGEGFRLVRREWPTDIGPVDLMCRDAEDGWVAVEIKRVGTIEAVEQLTRYLERLRGEPGMANVEGVLAAQQVKPQARTLAEGRGLRWVEVDLGVLRGEKQPDLTLFEV